MKEAAKQRITAALSPLPPEQQIDIAQKSKAALALWIEENPNGEQSSVIWEYAEYTTYRLIRELIEMENPALKEMMGRIKKLPLEQEAQQLESVLSIINTIHTPHEIDAASQLFADRFAELLADWLSFDEEQRTSAINLIHDSLPTTSIKDFTEAIHPTGSKSKQPGRPQGRKPETQARYLAIWSDFTTMGAETEMSHDEIVEELAAKYRLSHKAICKAITEMRKDAILPEEWHKSPALRKKHPNMFKE